MRILGACLGLAALLLLPGLLIGPSLDPAVFTEVGDRVASGATLYTGAWDHKPPGAYLLLAAFQFVLPFVSPWLITWVLSVIATGVTGWLLALACRRIGISVEASVVVAIAAVAAMAQYLMALGGGLTEPLAALPLAVALLLTLEPDGREADRRAASIGLLLVVALLISPQAAPGLMAILALVLARAEERPAQAAAGRAMAFGALVPVVGVLAFLFVTGALPDAVDALVRYSAAYRGISSTGGGLSGPVITWTLLALLFLIVPAAWGAMEALRQRGPRTVVIVACLIWVGVALVSFFVQGRFLAHYAIPLAIPLGMLAGIGVDRLDTTLTRTADTTRRVMLVAPFGLAILISLYAAIAAGGMEWEPIARDHQRSLAVAAAIADASDNDDRIWVWGNEPQVYLDAGRQAATPYGYLYPLVTPGYTTRETVERSIAALRELRPRLIIDAGSPAPGQPGMAYLLIPRAIASDGRDLDILDAIRRYVDRNYTYLDLVDGWVIYELRERGAVADGSATAAATGSSQSLRAATRR